MEAIQVYIAGGWFSPDQLKAVEDIENACEVSGVSYFSPRKAGIWKPGDQPYALVQGNISAIDNCLTVIASTAGKDMGTLWECGYAHAMHIPVSYYYTNTEHPFNIMLSATATKVITDYFDLELALAELITYGEISFRQYKGNMQ